VEVVKGVHLIESAKGSYVYLILGQEPVLIDTGMPGRAQAIVAELRQLGLNMTDIAHILLTHHDVDHIGNAKYLQSLSGAKLWASAEDLPYIEGTAKRPGFKRLLNSVVKPQIPNIDATYRPGETIADLEVIPTPGHTPGHVSVLYGDTLFAGDLVTSSKNVLKAAPAFLTWDKEALRSSLAEVGQRSFDWVCPAHGFPIQRGNLWEALLP